MLAVAVVILIGAVGGDAQEKKDNQTFTDPAKAGPDFAIQGEYQGETAKKKKIGVQIIAQGDGKFIAQLFDGGLPGDGWDGKARHEAKGQSENKRNTFGGTEWIGVVDDGKLVGNFKDGEGFELKHVVRESKTLGQKPPDGAIVLFDGKTLDGWTAAGGKKTTWKLVDGGAMEVGKGTLYSEKKFGPFKLHLEFRLPYMPHARGQARGNSGLYLQDRYECQLLDSFGLKGLNNECGGFYTLTAPKVNMCYPPLSWQTYDVDFTPAKFDKNGKKTDDAVVTVLHNGVPIHENLKLKDKTPGGQDEKDTPGPIHLQDHGNPVQFRNIWIVDKK